LDRIEEVIDYSTGEIIYDVAEFFAPYLGALASTSCASPRPAAHVSVSSNPRVAAAFRDGARVLLFVAISDGELHEGELAHVVEYCTSRLRRLKNPPTNAESIARRWITSHVPTRGSALAALGRLMVNDEDGRELAHSISDLIVADGAVTDGELAFAWSLVKAMEGRERYRPARMA
jgi:hypothetical protein